MNKNIIIFSQVLVLLFSTSSFSLDNHCVSGKNLRCIINAHEGKRSFCFKLNLINETKHIFIERRSMYYCESPWLSDSKCVLAYTPGRRDDVKVTGEVNDYVGAGENRYTKIDYLCFEKNKETTKYESVDCKDVITVGAACS